MQTLKSTDGRARRAKNPGTGLLDTPAETWTALFREYLAGSETLPDVAKRHGVRYSAALGKVGPLSDHWYWLRGAELLRTLPATEGTRIRRAHAFVRGALNAAPVVADYARILGLRAPSTEPLRVALRRMPEPPPAPTWSAPLEVREERPDAQVVPFRAPERAELRDLGAAATIIDLRERLGTPTS